MAYSITKSTEIPTYKTVFVGDAGCGKSSIIHRFHYNEFCDRRYSTIGGEFKSIEMNIDGSKLNIQTWDTAGQERYRSLVKLYFRDADAIIFVYDVTNETSLKNIDGWVREYVLHCPSADDDSVPLYLVGNKCDLPHDPYTALVNELSVKYGLIHIKTSAKKGGGVTELFTKIGSDLIKNKKKEHDDEIVDIASNTPSFFSTTYWSSYIPNFGKPKCC